MLFNRSAGTILLDMLELLPGASEVGKENGMSEIDGIFKILNDHFDSDRVQGAAEREFESSIQKTDEGNIAYLERVTKKA